MIEVPSAALLADVLAREVDFFSIGTNDLIQYTLAADRNNENVANLYNPADPAVLRLIEVVVEAASKQQIEVNVCGEMSGEPLYAPLLVGLGLRQLSATPRKIPEIKRVIRQLSVPEAERLAETRPEHGNRPPGGQLLTRPTTPYPPRGGRLNPERIPNRGAPNPGTWDRIPGECAAQVGPRTG